MILDLGLVIDVGIIDHFVNGIDKVFFEDSVVDNDSLVQVEEDVGEACWLKGCFFSCFCYLQIRRHFLG